MKLHSLQRYSYLLWLLLAFTTLGSLKATEPVLLETDEKKHNVSDSESDSDNAPDEKEISQNDEINTAQTLLNTGPNAENRIPMQVNNHPPKPELGISKEPGLPIPSELFDACWTATLEDNKNQLKDILSLKSKQTKAEIVFDFLFSAKVDGRRLSFTGLGLPENYEKLWGEKIFEIAHHFFNKNPQGYKKKLLYGFFCPYDRTADINFQQQLNDLETCINNEKVYNAFLEALKAEYSLFRLAFRPWLWWGKGITIKRKTLYNEPPDALDNPPSSSLRYKVLLFLTIMTLGRIYWLVQTLIEQRANFKLALGINLKTVYPLTQGTLQSVLLYLFRDTPWLQPLLPYVLADSQECINEIGRMLVMLLFWRTLNI